MDDNYLKELEHALYSGRCTGRTSKIIYNVIDRFFNEPIGSYIDIEDHYGEYNVKLGKVIKPRKINDDLVARIKEILNRYYPYYKYDIIYDFSQKYHAKFATQEKCYFIIRKTKTFVEKIKDEIINYKGEEYFNDKFGFLN